MPFSKFSSGVASSMNKTHLTIDTEAANNLLANSAPPTGQTSSGDSLAITKSTSLTARPANPSTLHKVTTNPSLPKSSAPAARPPPALTPHQAAYACPPLPASWTSAHDQAICMLDAKQVPVTSIAARLKRAFPDLRGVAVTPAMVERRLRCLDQIPEVDYWRRALAGDDEGGGEGRLAGKGKERAADALLSTPTEADFVLSPTSGAAGDGGGEAKGKGTRKGVYCSIRDAALGKENRKTDKGKEKAGLEDGHPPRRVPVGRAI
ncbi:hypothetical protein W97_00832 [Coniosporium apollinis CBS 100218]|uniref:Uncharacterized protein n=1 Tax=Coniosporium apollinis (strain CBS 100218) TaxID=1168221 RepID=R7YI90_CONA1|nr:uncharacterized protein W97_00832 [Coniosporium apollinis CBS 100218]EON61617.1 hypothetical protein W97_00832 [Coniosporium apollinis CBS 100218]